MKKKFIIAQLENIVNVTSPDAANINLYGNIPVSLYTGTPNISIPLYDIEVSSYTLPVTIDYHLQSIRATSQAGQLGLGWTINAGGQISRTVRGIMDESKTPDTQMGYLHNSGKLTEEKFKDLLNDYANLDNNAYELTTDEYSFSFCGYSGNFYLNPNGEWVVVSDFDIKVENFRCINKQELIRRFKNCDDWYNDTPDKHVELEEIAKLENKNDCFLDGFVLVTPDGCRYEFGGEYMVVFRSF